ncbi:hypothetical protein AV530_008531 [Patagioenas fasciata monilis]|uniref:Uncharacterized protein n=1 Tax=Patagioenas fasciata monilis TaxID=372326 RepID=A0A1V4L1I6_PATFA|nr:hypothetical protein AV530_008531 [Patagioenas fasciata monilis]
MPGSAVLLGNQKVHELTELKANIVTSAVSPCKFYGPVRRSADLAGSGSAANRLTLPGEATTLDVFTQDFLAGGI